MSFISPSDFTGEIALSQNEFNLNQIQKIIESTEETILVDLLGYDLYTKLIENLDSNYEPVIQIYKDLVNGKKYNITLSNGATFQVNYKGIKQMLRYFTYYYYLQSQQTQNTISGQVINQEENATKANKIELNELSQKIYNKGVNLYGNNKVLGTKDCPLSSVTIIRHSDYDIFESKATCFNFLNNHSSDYPTWLFTPKKQILFNGSI